ncbi:MAG: LLM class F420-dependent oxidoreductase [Actinomycetia bacterium]|nr:LLM class F420-dependent oxidoreductase [Actinomycetes bacterium]
MSVRVGFHVRPQHAAYSAMRQAWAAADSAGVDTIWTWDHFFPLHGDPDGKHFECWTLLAAMAEVTERAEIGALVTCNSYRNPHLLADMARTVDHISGGRLIFSIGAGWFERDYEEFGYEFGTPGSRLRAMEANIPIFKERMASGNPPPQRAVPLLIPGRGRKMSLRIVAEHADMWHSFGTPEEWGELNELLTEWCTKVGRDPAEIERMITPLTPEQQELLDDYADAGANHIIFGDSGPSYDLGLARELVAWRDARS